MLLELEIDEGLQVSSDKLIDEEDDRCGDECDSPEGEHSEVDTIPSFELIGQPVNGHAEREEQEGSCILCHDGGDDGEIPCATNLRNHVLCRLPCFLVGSSGVEVASRSEEKACESDESEGLRYRPYL